MRAPPLRIAIHLPSRTSCPQCIQRVHASREREREKERARARLAVEGLVVRDVGVDLGALPPTRRPSRFDSFSSGAVQRQAVLTARRRRERNIREGGRALGSSLRSGACVPVEKPSSGVEARGRLARTFVRPKSRAAYASISISRLPALDRQRDKPRGRGQPQRHRRYIEHTGKSKEEQQRSRESRKKEKRRESKRQRRQSLGYLVNSSLSRAIPSRSL